jgi:hypothetical protein
MSALENDVFDRINSGAVQNFKFAKPTVFMGDFASATKVIDGRKAATWTLA